MMVQIRMNELSHTISSKKQKFSWIKNTSKHYVVLQNITTMLLQLN